MGGWEGEAQRENEKAAALEAFRSAPPAPYSRPTPRPRRADGLRKMQPPAQPRCAALDGTGGVPDAWRPPAHHIPAKPFLFPLPLNCTRFHNQCRWCCLGGQPRASRCLEPTAAVPAFPRLLCKAACSLRVVSPAGAQMPRAHGARVPGAGLQAGPRAGGPPASPPHSPRIPPPALSRHILPPRIQACTLARRQGRVRGILPSTRRPAPLPPSPGLVVLARHARPVSPPVPPCVHMSRSAERVLVFGPAHEQRGAGTNCAPLGRCS